MRFKYDAASWIAFFMPMLSSFVNVTVPLRSLINASLCQTPVACPNTLLSKPNFAFISANVGPPTYSVCHTIPISALLICPANSESAGTVYTIVLGLNAITSSPPIFVLFKSSFVNNISPCATVCQFNLLKVFSATINLSCSPGAG